MTPVPDADLIALALGGDRDALTQLVENHQDFIYNVALKFFNNLDDARDAAQEVLIKVISRLSTFDAAKAAFRTWLYQITFHHFLDAKANSYEKNVTGFGMFFDLIESVPSQALSPEEEVVMALDVKESMVSCTAGMIMCLDRDQRLTYILGDVFELDHKLAADALETTPDNFRQKLSRARKDLYQWMNRRCGLVNLSNPCRCPKKTKGFISRGWVNPENRKWHSGTQQRIRDVVEMKIDEVAGSRDRIYQGFYQEHPFKAAPEKGRELLNTVLQDKTFAGFFQLRSNASR